MQYTLYVQEIRSFVFSQNLIDFSQSVIDSTFLDIIVHQVTDKIFLSRESFSTFFNSSQPLSWIRIFSLTINLSQAHQSSVTFFLMRFSYSCIFDNSILIIQRICSQSSITCNQRSQSIVLNRCFIFKHRISGSIYIQSEEFQCVSIVSWIISIRTTICQVRTNCSQCLW